MAGGGGGVRVEHQTNEVEVEVVVGVDGVVVVEIAVVSLLPPESLLMHAWLKKCPRTIVLKRRLIPTAQTTVSCQDVLTVWTSFLI